MREEEESHPRRPPPVVDRDGRVRDDRSHHFRPRHDGSGSQLLRGTLPPSSTIYMKLFSTLSHHRMTALCPVVPSRSLAGVHKTKLWRNSTRAIPCNAAMPNLTRLRMSNREALSKLGRDRTTTFVRPLLVLNTQSSGREGFPYPPQISLQCARLSNGVLLQRARCVHTLLSQLLPKSEADSYLQTARKH